MTIADNLGGPTLAFSSMSTHRSLVLPGTGQPICAGGGASDSSYDVFGDSSCGLSHPTDRISSAPLALEPLASSGGSAIINGSSVMTRVLHDPIVLDAIPIADCVIALDQRSVSRPQRVGCDVGAVEVE